MVRRTICRVAGGVLVVLVGIAVGFAGILLWSGAPSSWPDPSASVATTRSTGLIVLLLAVLLLVSGAAATINVRWGPLASVIAILAFVVGGFWANYVLFGDIRLAHTGVNVILSAFIVLLLWAGSRRDA